MNFGAIYIGFLIVSTIYRIRRLIGSYSKEPKAGKVSFSFTYPILLFLYLAVWLGAIFEYFYLTYILQIQEIDLWVSLIGFVMYVGVIPLRNSAASTLGKHLSSDIKITEGHLLVKDGPYRYIRHPLVFCTIIEAFGLALIPNSYYTFLVALFGFMPFMLFRVYLEEKALIEKFGEEYINYKKEVFGFFPIKKVKSDNGGAR